MQLILASASPRRKDLLRKAGYRFRIVPSRIQETAPRSFSPQRLVKHLALKKAVSISRKYPLAVVLGADTIVYLKGRVIGKPKNPKHAKRMLKKISGVWQKVYTGVAVVQQGGKQAKTGVAVSRVKLRRLTPEDVARASKKHLDKAGAYAVQERRDPFVERIIGDYDNVVGLPMRLVRRLLGRAGHALPKTLRDNGNFKG